MLSMGPESKAGVSNNQVFIDFIFVSPIPSVIPHISQEAQPIKAVVFSLRILLSFINRLHKAYKAKSIVQNAYIMHKRNIR